MNYTDYVNQLSTMMAEQDITDPSFQAILPNIIDYAEGRLYRDLDMIGTRYGDSTSVSLTALDRGFTLPANTWVVEGINVETPTGRVQLVPTTREYLDWAWPNVSAAGVPAYFAMIGQLTGIVGPYPDQAYQLGIRTVVTQTPLSAANPTTLLTKYLPDVFFAASMIQATGYQKNFGSQSDDPQQAMSWEAQYNNLIKQATVFEFRKKFQSEAWTSQPINPVVQPPRM